MKILIVEDEIRIAKLLERLIKKIWGAQLTRLHHCRRLGEANNFLSKHPVDLLFLDLNLQGQNGFDLLQKFTAQAFHVVVVSAYRERALEAFEYGALDFIPKPFNRERLQKTFDRLMGTSKDVKPTAKFISIKKSGNVLPIRVAEIIYIQANGHYTALHLTSQRKELSDHSMDKLEILLPNDFFRIHRSYLVNLNEALEINKHPGSKYELRLKSGIYLPIGRSRLKALRERINF